MAFDEIQSQLISFATYLDFFKYILTKFPLFTNKDL